MKDFILKMRALAPVGLVLWAACSSQSGDTVTPSNQAPSVTFTFTKLGVARNTTTDLSISASDPNDDPLTITWSITRGTLTPQNTQHTVMRWAVPATLGTDTVRVAVSDGQFTHRLTEPIEVGYAITQPPAVFLKSRSPYILSVDPNNPIATIGLGAVDSIQAGVEILLDTPATEFEVTGSILAQGTADEPVVFRPNVRGLQCGDSRGWWDGFRGASFDTLSNGNIEFHHTQLWYAQNGIRLSNLSSADLEDCSIKCSGDNGILAEGYGSLVVRNTEVTDGRGNGISVDALAGKPTSVIIDHCQLRFNGASGLRLAISYPDVPITVEYNRFEYNYVRAITLGRSAFPVIHFNEFFGNGVSTSGSNVMANIYLETGYPNGADIPQLDATCNYWGASIANASTIDATIRDSLDSNSIGTRVIFDPWLNDDPWLVTPNCTPATH